MNKWWRRKKEKK